MSNLKKWIGGAFLTIAGLVGYHAAQRPVVTNDKAPIVNKSAMAPMDFSQNVAVRLSVISGASGPDETKMITDGILNENKMLLSDCFKQKVLNADFTETNIGDSETDLTNQQIWNLISGQVITINVTIFDGTWYQNHVSHTMAIEDENYPGTVFINRYYINTEFLVGDSATHETMHVLGFHHYTPPMNQTSVPYMSNQFYEDCATTVGLIQ